MSVPNTREENTTRELVPGGADALIAMPRARRGLPRIYAGARRWLMVKLIACGAGRVIVAFAVAMLMREIASNVGRQGPTPVAEIVTLVVIAAALLMLRVRESIDAERLGQDYVCKVRLRLFAGLVAGPLHEDGNPHVGLTMNRMITDLSALKNWVSLGLARLVVACISLLGSLGVLVYLSPTVALAVFVMVGLFMAGVAGLTATLRRRVREARRQRGRLARYLGDVIPAMTRVVHSGRGRTEWRRLRRRGRELANACVRRTAITAIPSALPDAAFPAGAALLFFLASFEELQWGQVLGALTLLGLTTSSLRDIARAWAYRLSFVEARRRLHALLRNAAPTPSRGARRLLTAGSPSVE